MSETDFNEAQHVRPQTTLGALADAVRDNRDAPLQYTVIAGPAPVESRVIAKVFDGVILGSLMLLCVAMVRFALFPIFTGLILAYMATNLIPGGSPGKRLFQIRILRNDGSDISLHQATVRWLAHYGFLLSAVVITAAKPLIPYDIAKFVVGVMLISVGWSVASLITVIWVGRSIPDLLTGTTVGAPQKSFKQSHAFEVITDVEKSA